MINPAWHITVNTLEANHDIQIIQVTNIDSKGNAHSFIDCVVNKNESLYFSKRHYEFNSEKYKEIPCILHEVTGNQIAIDKAVFELIKLKIRSTREEVHDLRTLEEIEDILAQIEVPKDGPPCSFTITNLNTVNAVLHDFNSCDDLNCILHNK